MKTKLITFEGIDGSGKTVQLDMLSERLTDLGFTAAKRGYPVYTSFFGSQIGKYLSAAEGVRATAVDQKSMALWFAMDRFRDFRGYRDGETDFLLVNRYVLSNAVYQSIRDCDIDKPDIVDWVFELEYEKLGLPRPDLNLFFDVEPQRAGVNVEKKGYRDYVGKKKDVYEMDSSIQQRARQKYFEIASRFADTVIIPCMEKGEMRSPKAICESVMKALKQKKLI